MIAGRAGAPGAQRVEAGTARLFPLRAGQSARIIAVSGSQVADTWALCAADLAERLSMSHTRGTLGRVCPRPGDLLYSGTRTPMLRFERDTSPGLHDTLVPACDPERYRLLGHPGYHRNCRDNYASAVASPALYRARPRSVERLPEHPGGRGRAAALRAVPGRRRGPR